MNKEDLKIVFFGTPDFAVTSLKAIIDAGYNVKAVVTATDKVAGRGHKMQSPSVKVFAESVGLTVLQPQSLKDECFISSLREIDADLFVVIAFRMLPEVVWAMPRLGTFNLHASLLPKYRGAAPINHAIINGETKTGVTTFFLQHEIDTGDIIDRVEVVIEPEDNVGTLHDKLMELGAQLTVKTIQSIIDGTLQTVPQSQLLNANEIATPAPKIFKNTCAIDWTKTAVEVHNKVRGLSPYPGAWSVLETPEPGSELEVKIFETANTERPVNSVPGSFVIEKDKLYVNCADNQVEIKILQPSGKRRMHTADFLRGAREMNSAGAKFSLTLE